MPPLQLIIRNMDTDEEYNVRVSSNVRVKDLIKATYDRWLNPNSRGRLTAEDYHMWEVDAIRALKPETRLTQLNLPETAYLIIGRTPPLPCKQVSEKVFEESESDPTPNLNAYLIYQEPAKDEKVFRLDRLPVVIGRHNPQTRFRSLARQVIHHQAFTGALNVSRDHAIIFYHKNQAKQINFYLLPLAKPTNTKGPNYTYINGTPLKFDHAYLLQSGDLLNIGGINFTFHW